jgi:hypothetical protein
MSFPILKTGAVAQHPAGKGLRLKTEVVRFIDGREQRYREMGGPLRWWVVRLDLLDEGELTAIEEFFRENQGAFGSFAFSDPWDGTEHPDCSLDQDSLEMAMGGELKGHTALTIRENRS